MSTSLPPQAHQHAERLDMQLDPTCLGEERKRGGKQLHPTYRQESGERMQSQFQSQFRRPVYGTRKERGESSSIDLLTRKWGSSSICMLTRKWGSSSICLICLLTRKWGTTFCRALID